MYFPQEQLHGDEGVFSGALGDISKPFKPFIHPVPCYYLEPLHERDAELEGNNMIIDTYQLFHLVLFCSYENQTSGDSLLLLGQVGHCLILNTNLWG